MALDLFNQPVYIALFNAGKQADLIPVGRMRTAVFCFARRTA